MKAFNYRTARKYIVYLGLPLTLLAFSLILPFLLEKDDSSFYPRRCTGWGLEKYRKSKAISNSVESLKFNELKKNSELETDSKFFNLRGNTGFRISDSQNSVVIRISGDSIKSMILKKNSDSVD